MRREREKGRDKIREEDSVERREEERVWRPRTSCRGSSRVDLV
jgi:hypothetical protein